MAERREDAELGGIADEDVEPAPAVQNPRGELVDLDEIAQVERDEGGAAAGRANRVVDLFEAADRARRQHHMRALAANRSATAAPMPRDAPVINAILSARRPRCSEAILVPDHQVASAAASGCRSSPRTSHWRTTIKAMMLRPAVNIR